ncbi:MAG: hypothetical protein ABIS50_10270 [Luteolibacter sp.]|uniref:hypothetical protein n=1 Tax=Luteolibacter sp. TaxID=1962973 RepID=UPI00326371AA
MDDRNIRRFERATRVQTFGRDNTADLTAGGKAAALFLELDPIVFELTEARVGQLRTPVGKPVLIDALSTDFKDIARTARAIKIDEPAFDDAAYRHPGTSVETPVTTHADSLLKLLEDNTTPVADGGDTPAQLAAKAALRGKFIAYELPADFVEDLRADRDALDNCNSGKHSDNLEGVESTSAIDTLLGEAQAIITRLDAAIQNKYSRDPDKLAAWKSASRTERAAKKAEPIVTPPPAN